MGNACGCCPSTPAVTSSQPTVTDLVESMKRSLSENGDPTQQIDLLINFLGDGIPRIKAPREATSTSTPSSSGVSQESVVSRTKAAAQLIDFVSSEADKLKSTKIPKEMEIVATTVLNKISEKHLALLGLSLAAYALQRLMTANSNVSECIEILTNLVDLAKDLKKFKEAFPEEEEREKVSKAICVIVEGTFICADYIQKGRGSRLKALFQPIYLNF